jgi:hypothetical protein
MYFLLSKIFQTNKELFYPFASGFDFFSFRVTPLHQYTLPSAVTRKMVLKHFLPFTFQKRLKANLSVLGAPPQVINRANNLGVSNLGF